MAITEQQATEWHYRATQGRTFTLNEACDIMRQFEPYRSISWNWVNAKTGKPVSIGYNNISPTSSQ